MKVERATFLALTAAIAAACSATKDPVSPVMVPEPSPEAGADGNTSATRLDGRFELPTNRS